jgi:23S rRNA pseudouridine2605 synthase
MQPSESTTTERSLIRLQKFLASAGFGSRRQCEEYILAGRVTVDGQTVVELGTRVDPSRQKIHVDGELIRTQAKRYFVLNKPAGYLCTHSDPEGRARAIDLVPHDGPRLFTVGRLDESSEGLILVTNDGELANRLAHPRYEVPRKYRVHVAGRPTPETLRQLRRGLVFEEGTFRVQGVRKVGGKGNSTFLEIDLKQGRNREIRRMLARVGHKVMHLERIAFGPLNLGRLPLGKYRRLTDNELKALRALAAGEEPKSGKPQRKRRPRPRRKVPR